MHRNFPLFLVFLLTIIIDRSHAANWAVLVAGSKGWSNYRHQADVCHAYQILHKNGIPDSNIIVMMYDDLAHNIENPTKGIVINHPNGNDVYHGVPHDYTGIEVTPKTFIDVLLGNKEAVRGVGSGKVLESGPNDNVFIYFTDHGAVGLVAFPHGVLYAQDLNDTIAKMHSSQKYKQMVVYIEACESGSMLENLLPTNINVYATTASNAQESSYACYYDAKRHTYLGDVYSVVWMEDSDSEKLNEETLYQQFLITQAKTNTSHVMQYGDLNLGKSHNVSEFQGENSMSNHFIKKLLMKRKRDTTLRNDAVASENVRLAIVNHRLAAAKDSPLEKAFYQQQLEQLIHAQSTIRSHIERIASTVLIGEHIDQLENVKTTHMKLTEHHCYRLITTHIAEKCFDLENEMVLNQLYIVANLCQIGYQPSVINQAIDQVCTDRLEFDY